MGIFKIVEIDGVGRDGDKLRVSATLKTMGSAKLRHEHFTSDVNYTNAGYTEIYSYAGTGLLHSFAIEMKEKETLLKVEIDSTELIFEDFRIHDLPSRGGDGGSRQNPGGFIWRSHNNKRVQVDFKYYAIPFASSAKIYLKSAKSGTNTMKDGYVAITTTT